MLRRALGLSLAVSLLAVPLAALAAAEPPVDAEVARGVRLAEEGDYDEAIVVLDAATRRLSAAGSPSRELGEAFLYLGVAYLAKGHEITAKARFREALAQIHDLRLSADKFAPRVVEIFEAAREEAERARAAAAAPAPTTSASPGRAPATAKKKGGSKGLLIAGAGVAVAAGVALAVSGGSDGSSPGSSSSSTYRLDAGDSQALAPEGGGFGSNNATLACPAGSLATGITGAATITFLTRLGLVCRVLGADGSTGTDTVLPAAGGQADGAPFVDECPTGQAVVRIMGSTGLYLSSITVVQNVSIGCVSVADWVAGSGTISQRGGHGPTGPAAFTSACAPGYVLTGLMVNSGSLVDRFQGVCTRVRR